MRAEIGAKSEIILRGTEAIAAWEDAMSASMVFSGNRQSDSLTALGSALRASGAENRVFTSASPSNDGGLVRIPITANFSASPQSARTAIVLLRDGSHHVRVTRLSLKRRADAMENGLCAVDMDLVALTSAQPRGEGGRHAAAE